MTLDVARRRQRAARPSRCAACAATTDGDGEAHVDVGALPPGAYRLTGRATIDGRAVAEDKTFVVRAGGPELDDVAARDRVLRELAQVSGGDYRSEELPRLARPRPRARSASAASRPSRSGRVRRCCCSASRC